MRRIHSSTGEHWHAGLRKLFADDWRGALESIKAADRLQPEFPDLRRLMAEAEDKINNPPPRPFPWGWAVGGVAAVSLVVLGVATKRRVRANRLRTSAADIVRLREDGTPPLVLDVRDGLLYRASPYRLPDALRLDPWQMEHDLAALGLEPGRPLVTYCSSEGERVSAEVARRLQALGYTDVRVLRGGLAAWAGAGLPLESKAPGG